LLITLETVAVETLANLAMSLMVNFFISIT